MSDGISKISGTLNRLVSDVPNPVDTLLYTSTIKRSQRSSEALLNAAAECYLEGVYTRDIGKIFAHFQSPQETLRYLGHEVTMIIQY